MYRIAKEFRFSAAHRIEGLPDGHPCGRRHGHNYVVTLILEAEELDAVGFVRDFGDLKWVAEWIDANLDHRDLNLVLVERCLTTCEDLARFLYWRFVDRFPELAAVRVSETPKTWAEYRP